MHTVGYNISKYQSKKMDIAFLSEAELKQRSEIIEDLNDAYKQRNQSYVELDGMTYDQYYITNKKAGCGYIKPKDSPSEVRTVTGTTREKVTTVVTALLRYEFDYEVTAFDKGKWVDRDLGDGLEGLVRKSRELERPNYSRKLPLFYSEFASQGNIFLYESSIEEEVISKEFKGVDIEDAKWEEVKELEQRFDVDMIPGINIYLGNIREFFISNQPFIGIRREIPRSLTKRLYGSLKTYKKVKEYIESGERVLVDKGGQEYNDWWMIDPKGNFDEEIRYFNKGTNTYQILLNGIPMLPVGFPLEYIFGIREYPIVKVDAEPISRHFAYCRGLSAKNKFNQAIIDELYKIIILKFRKSANPPLSNLSGRTLSRSIFYPETIHTGIDPEKVKPIGDNSGVSSSEYSTFQLIKSAIDEASVSPMFEGIRVPGEKTAREVMELKTQSLMRLGMIIVGIIQMEEDLVWLRIYNILRHWTKPRSVKLETIKGRIKETNEYREEAVQRQFRDGTSGVQIVEFTEEVPSSEQVYAEEELMTGRAGVNIRKVYLSVNELKGLRHKFYIEVTPSERSHSELRAALFEESMLKALQVFPDTVNRAYFQEEWANHIGIDPNKAFISGGEGMMMGGSVEGMGSPEIDKSLSAQFLPQTTQQNKPSLKQML